MLCLLKHSGVRARGRLAARTGCKEQAALCHRMWWYECSCHPSDPTRVMLGDRKG